MPAKAKQRQARSLDTIVKRIGPHGEAVPLTVVASAVLLLGSGLTDEWLAYLADCDDPVFVLEQVMKASVACAPWLDGHMGPLLDWTPGDDGADKVRQVARCFADVDFRETVNTPPCSGDILGPLYGELRGRHGQRATGAFYTPFNVALMLGMMADPEEGQSVCDPCCGSGAMLTAAARSMRQAGRDPQTCVWVGNDIDPMAVALAGVNMTAHGLGPRIWLTCGDGLLLGTGHERDPHVLQPPWWTRKEAVEGAA